MKKIILNIIYILITITAVFFIHNFIYHEGSYISWCEDLFEPYWASTSFSFSSPQNIFRVNSHNSFLQSIPYILFEVYFPKLLYLHPLTCFQYITSYIYSFIFFTLLYIISLNFTKYFKNKYIISFVLVLIIIPVFITVIEFSLLTYIFYNRAWMCAYFILPIFALVLFLELSEHFVLNKDFSNKTFVTLCLLLFCVANSYEILKYITLAFLFLRIGIYALLNKEKIYLKKYLILLSVYIVSNLILIFLYKGSEYIHLIDLHIPYQQLIVYFKGFFTSYTKYILLNNAITLSLIIVLLISIFFVVKDKINRQNFYYYTFSVLFSVMTYPLMTILFNFNPDGWQYDSYFHYVCDHIGTRYIISIFLLCILLSCCGFLLSSLQTKRQKITIFLIMILTLIPIYKFIVIKRCNLWYLSIRKDEGKTFLNERKTNLYILEKFFAMYGRNNGVFYTYSPHNVTYYDEMIAYLWFLYSTNSNLGILHPDVFKYKVIHVCSDDDNLFTVCKDKMLKVIKDKTGYEFSTEELEKTDFESIKQYLHIYW